MKITIYPQLIENLFLKYNADENFYYAWTMYEYSVCHHSYAKRKYDNLFPEQQ